MDNLVIGCRTLENELCRAMDECGCTYDVKWVESGLHNSPKKLTAALQDIIDSSQSYPFALMALGYCGNSLSGLKTGDLTLIIPRVDDCISLLLGSHQNRAAMIKNGGVYFMTEGWLRGERNIWNEYEYTVKKYGEELGKEIFDELLAHYNTLALLDTGCFELPIVAEEMKVIADTLGLEYKVMPATIEYLKKLLTGPWDDESFLTIPPQSVIKESDLTLKS